MGSIRILSEHVVNKIAAGEVVERPASVVKELLDNAFDAGASSVRVMVTHGGKSAIRVSDDGCGMDEQDARSCLIRHATSKIASLEDIQEIATMGFRGEALPSIASVSRLTITTRTPDDETAIIVQADGGTIASVCRGAHAPGTTIDVEDLFFNTPARRRFLKSDTAEYSVIAETCSTLALSRPDIAFTLQRGDFTAAEYPVCATLQERIARIYGSEFTEQLYELDVREGGVTVQGFIGSPEHTRVNRTGQKFFVNRRPVQSPALNNALSRAYDEFIPDRRFPVAVLFFDIRPDSVDVNVHPAKREVRIRDERAFLDQFTRSVRAVLCSRGVYVQPNAHSASRAAAPMRSAEPRSAFNVGRETEALWQVPETPQSNAHTHTDVFSSVSSRPTVKSGFVPDTEHSDLPFDMTGILGQVLACYLVVESRDGFFLIDQHAAHERIIYESLLEALQREKPIAQQLLFPATLHVSEQEAAAVREYRSVFEAMGFGLHNPDSESLEINAVPGCLTDYDALSLLRDCLHELLERSSACSFDSHTQELAAVLACKTRAVKAGRILEHSEQLHLIRALAACDNPHTCPHGRPTCIRISRSEIEKRFQRT